MLRKESFVEMLTHILEQEESARNLDDALKKYGEKDLSGFATKEPAFLVDWLNSAMDIDKDDDTISWWLWDAPDAGKGSKKYCTVEFTNSNKKPFVVKTPGDVYDLIVMDRPNSGNNGIDFALDTILEIRKDNQETHEPGWRERDTLIKLIYDKIDNEWKLTHAEKN